MLTPDADPNTQLDTVKVFLTKVVFTEGNPVYRRSVNIANIQTDQAEAEVRSKNRVRTTRHSITA